MASRPFRRVGWLALALLLTAGAIADADAQRMQDRPNAAEAERAISRLRSPYCPGFMLDVCTSSQAAALRDSIYDLAAEGMTADELVDWMLARHGEEFRAVPLRSGAGLWAWLIPPIAALAGIAVMVFWLRANRASDTGAAVAEADLTDADREVLAAALRDWDATAEEDV